MTALGMIEVRGYLGAITAADVALKTAAVELNQAEITRGGLTTIQVTGDVAAVKAAVDAATTVAASLNVLVSSHVIPRLDLQTEAMLAEQGKNSSPENSEHEVKENSLPLEIEAIETEIVPETEVTQAAPSSEKVSLESQRQVLEKMKVIDLRKMAYKMNLKGMTKKEIKFAKKDQLVVAILSELEGSEIEWS